MEHLVRKISRAKWDSKQDIGPNAIQADAVTSDLRTIGNTLSFWQCPKIDSNELQEVALALAAALDQPDKIDIAWLRMKDVEDKPIRIEKTPGDTRIKDLRDKHMEAVSLDLQKICSLAKCLCKSIREEENFKRYTRRDVLNILCNAIKQNRLSIEELPEKISKALRPMLQT